MWLIFRPGRGASEAAFDLGVWLCWNCFLPLARWKLLRAAVCNGADAVYLGADVFNARGGARNFTPEELPEAVRYCHVRGVQVHLTLNTLVTDREMQKLAGLIASSARAGVDAFIVQDLGVLALCRQIAPQIALHASTQMSIHSLEGVRQAAALGVSRVVLARELPQEDIAFICKKQSRGDRGLCARRAVHVLFRPVLYVRRDRAALRQPRAMRPALPDGLRL